MSEMLTKIEAALVEELNKTQNTHAEDLPSVIQAMHVPGLSFVVFKAGEIEAVGSYGHGDAAQTRAITPETMFQVASNSKSINALICLRLVEAGVLDLQTDVNTYLKSWQVPAGDGWQPKITLYQLLSHTAGTTVGGFMGYAADGLIPTVSQILAGEKPANNLPIIVDTLAGHSVRYSGGGTTIIQQLLIDVTGKDFPALAHEWVFEPLGMTSSRFMQPPTPDFYDQVADGHYYTGQPIAGRWRVHPELAAAGLWSTPTDMSIFVRAIQAGKRGEHPVMSQQVVDWMLTPVMTDGPITLSLGVFQKGDGADLVFGHGGSNVGFQCDYKAFVDGRAGYSIMTNSDMGELIVGAMGTVFSKFYGTTSETASTPSEIDLASYMGAFKNEKVHAELTHESDGLYLQWNGQAALKLEAKSVDEFSVAGLKTTLQIQRDEDKQVQALIVQQNGTEQKLEIVP